MADPFVSVFDYLRVEPIVDKNGVMLTKFSSALNGLVTNSTITPTAIQENTDAIVLLAVEVDANTAQIALNVTQIGLNTTQISLNVTAIGDVTTNFNTHNASNSQHGVSGNNVGTLDFATSGTGGVVNEAVNVADAVASTVSVTSPDAPAAAATYSQADTQANVDLTNELKADVNTLTANLNSAITQVNEILTAMQNANQMAP